MNDFENLIHNIDLSNFIVNQSYICSVQDNIDNNKIFIDYYKKLSKEDKSISKTLINNFENCNKLFNCDVYYDNSIIDFKNTLLCHDKFCSNCKKVKQASRMSRYIPYLEKHKDNLYFLTLTLPNCNGSDLRYTLKHISYCFKELYRYLSCFYQCSFINFSKYHINGCVRALEITYKNNDIYHPHYHCAVVMDNLDFKRDIINSYSYSYKNGFRKFSDLEIIIQKLWYMLINKIRITKENYDSIDLGYSCTLDKLSDNDFIDMFKYMTKSTDESGEVMSYDIFKCLYYSLRFVKQIQGYGILYMINDVNIDDEVDKIYCDIKDLLLNLSDRPTFSSYDLDTLKYILDTTGFTFISRKSIYQYLRNLSD